MRGVGVHDKEGMPSLKPANFGLKVKGLSL